MEYTNITYEQAIDIVDGANGNGGTRKLFVYDSCGVAVYADKGSLYSNDMDMYYSDELLIGARKAKSCTWWVGADGDQCVLEARDKDGSVVWQGDIRVIPPSPSVVTDILAANESLGK